MLFTKKIVITGGPSTGKTTVIKKLEELGFSCIHEVIREMINEKTNNSTPSFKTNPINCVKNPIDFNTKLLNARIAQYDSAKKQKSNFIFFDRGIPDILAYMDCFGQFYGSTFTEACSNKIYNKVFIMPPWPEIHTLDNERFESFEECLEINDSIIKTYTGFGYDIQIVPKAKVSRRINFILEQLNTTY